VGGGRLNADSADLQESFGDFGGFTFGEPLAVHHARDAGDVALFGRAVRVMGCNSS
jgi:hypothetical protein